MIKTVWLRTLAVPAAVAPFANRAGKGYICSFFPFYLFECFKKKALLKKDYTIEMLIEYKC
jgi:hypothetical protein